jgi:hypothetical protein
VKLGGMIDDAMAQKRPILHQSEHGAFPPERLRFLGLFSPAVAKVSGRAGRRNGLVATRHFAKCRHSGQNRVE